MKKIILGFIIGACTFTSIGVFAVSKNYIINDNKFPIKVNKQVVNNIEGYNINDYTFLKLSDIGKALGNDVKVLFNQTDSTIEIEKTIGGSSYKKTKIGNIDAIVLDTDDNGSNVSEFYINSKDILANKDAIVNEIVKALPTPVPETKIIYQVPPGESGGVTPQKKANYFEGFKVEVDGVMTDISLFDYQSTPMISLNDLSKINPEFKTTYDENTQEIIIKYKDKTVNTKLGAKEYNGLKVDAFPQKINNEICISLFLVITESENFQTGWGNIDHKNKVVKINKITQ